MLVILLVRSIKHKIREEYKQEKEGKKYLESNRKTLVSCKWMLIKANIKKKVID